MRRRGDLGPQARRFALVGHHDARHGIHILFERDIAPDVVPQPLADERDDHAAVGGLEEDQRLPFVIGSQVLVRLHHVEDLLGGFFRLVAGRVDHIGLDHRVEVALRNAQRLQDIVLLLAQFVCVLAFLQRQGGQRQQNGDDDDHHGRVEDDIGIGVLVREQPALLRARISGTCLDDLFELRSRCAANGTFGRCGIAFVDIAADFTFEFLGCHNSLPILQV